jgi:hypothetical protein
MKMKGIEKKFYTQEGKEYALRFATKNARALVVAAPTNYVPTIQFNAATLSSNAAVLDIGTVDKILPIQMYLSFVEFNNATFSEDDFLPTNNGLILYYQRNMAKAFTDTSFTNVVIPAATYNVSLGFVYLELL